MAAITGPVNGKWRYDSFGKPTKNHRHGQYEFPSEKEALDFAKQKGYTNFARWKTTPKQDKKAQKRADSWHSGNGESYETHRKYQIDGDNCQAMVDDMADGAKIFPYIPNFRLPDLAGE